MDKYIYNSETKDKIQEYINDVLESGKEILANESEKNVAPFEIRIVQNIAVEEYINSPFKLYINGKEIKNVKRFAIDLDIEKLLSNERSDIYKAIPCCMWKYIIEYAYDVTENLIDQFK